MDHAVGIPGTGINSSAHTSLRRNEFAAHTYLRRNKFMAPALSHYHYLGEYNGIEDHHHSRLACAVPAEDQGSLAVP
jgi:hypothetical protein